MSGVTGYWDTLLPDEPDEQLESGELAAGLAGVAAGLTFLDAAAAAAASLGIAQDWTSRNNLNSIGFCNTLTT